MHCAGAEPEDQEPSREAAAARVATLAVTLLTAFAVHNADKDTEKDKAVPVKVPLAATWRVRPHDLIFSGVSLVCRLWCELCGWGKWSDTTIADSGYVPVNE